MKPFKNKDKLLDFFLSVDDEAMHYKAETLPLDDYMISCDYHAPYHNQAWVNRLLSIADRFQIKRHIIVGDLFDMDFAKKWYTDESSSLDDEIKETRPVIKALDYFNKNHLVQGNHETRIGRLTDAKIQARHLFTMFGGDIWLKKFEYSTYDKIYIGKDWMLVHPKSYSQVSPQVARRLAEKYHRHIINSHGHLLGLSYDRSGKFLTIDLGGMFHIEKVEYINKHTTTHPTWKNGFGMLRNGYFHHFTDATDWNFWLR